MSSSLARVAEIDAALIASAGIDIVKREHAGYLASFKADAVERLACTAPTTL